MRSDFDRASSFLDTLSKVQKLHFLANLVFELTLAGRMCYTAGSSGLDNPVLLREINERQHRLASQIRSILSTGSFFCSTTDFVASYLEPNAEDKDHARIIRNALIHALTNSLHDKEELP